MPRFYRNDGQLLRWRSGPFNVRTKVIANLDKLIDEHGFVIVPGVISETECDRLIEAIDGVHLSTSGNFRQPHQSIGEIARLVESPPLRALLPANAFLTRSIFFDKTPARNWTVPWHQDLAICVWERKEAEGFGSWSVKEGIVHTHAPAAVLDNMLTIRLHLDNCGPDNGPLRVIPGSHRNGRLNDAQIEEFRATRAEEVCIVPRGGALLMKPLLLHASSRAATAGHRRVLHLEFATDPLPGGLEWIQS